MTASETPTVFIVDDDGRMCAATQRLLQELRSPLFSSPATGIFP